MPNSIALAKNYIALLDEVYKLASLTSVLDSNPTGMRQGANANEILIQKLSMDGLADYSRNDITGALSARLDLGQGSGPMDHTFDIKSAFTEEAAE